MYAVWFVFTKDDTEYFADIIKALSKQYNSQIFEPHITAYGLVDVDLNVLDKIVTNVIKGEKQFTVEKSIVSYSDDFWMTLFVKIKPNEQLDKINKKLTESLDAFNKYEFKPHVSLIYKKMNQDEQEKITNSISIKEHFKVIGICIQQYNENIEKWKIIRKYTFEI